MIPHTNSAAVNKTRWKRGPIMEVGAEGVAGGGNHGREENDSRQCTRNHQQGTVAGDEFAAQQVPESARGDSVVHA